MRLANDIVALLETLGVGRVALVGHDRGARVATRLVKDHPERIDRLVVMDNVPTRIVAREMNAKVAREYWFFMFHLIFDLPEAERMPTRVCLGTQATDAIQRSVSS